MKKLFSVLFLCLSISLLSQSQQLPIDTSVRKGVLSNGLTYYIKHNEKPKDRCEFHIAQNVGSILENDDQLGLAHFLEHMAFNGSEHFPDKGIINYFEKIGVSFGNNINAYTSIDETVYRLSNVPTYRDGIIDTALLTLYDWSCAISLLDKEIDKERGVIVSEWRTTNSAARRMYTELSKVKYAGSQYENRMPIGDTAVIKNFKYQALRDYYHKWYGPDLQAIVVVGDIDVDKMEQKIKSLFGKIPPRKNRGERPMYGLKENKEPIVAFVKDKEAQYSVIELQLRSNKQSTYFKLSEEGYIKSLIDMVISSVFSYRFEEQTLNPECNYLNAGVGYDNITKKDDVAYAVVMAKEGKEKDAFRDMMIELGKASQNGFTNAEIERAKKDIMNSFEKSYNEQNNITNVSLAKEYIRNFIDSEPIPGIAWEYNFAKVILPKITKEDVNIAVKSYFSDNNPIISFQGADKPDVVFPSKEDVLSIIGDIENTKFEYPIEEIINSSIIDTKPKAGKIKKRVRSISLGTTEWTLSNGVKIVFKPTKFKTDEILLNAFSWGGTNKIETNDLPSALLTDGIIERNGLGKFSYLELQKALTGKIANVSTSIQSDIDNIDGNSSIKDFETMLQLVYLKFQIPRRDEAAYKSFMDLMKNSITNREKNPRAIFSDSVSAKWRCHDPRNLIMNLDLLNRVDYNKVLHIYRQRYETANDFIFVFTGNINPQDKNTENLICTWLGSLPKGDKEEYTPQANNHPKGKYISNFSTKMEIDNTKNAIRYYANMDYNWSNTINMRTIGAVLDYRYMETIREDEGGSYGVGVYGYVNKLPVAEGILNIQFDCDPAKQSALTEIIHSEIVKLAKEGPTETDLKKAKESMIKDFEEDIEKNSYWSSILETYYLYGRDYINDYRQMVEAVTKESVMATLKQLLSSGNIFEVFMTKEK